MTLTNSSRKRECSEDPEYLPVTKRMNNLHIDIISEGANHLNESLIGRPFNGSELFTTEQRLDQNQSHNQLLNAMNGQNYIQNRLNCLIAYSPELDSNSNPIYYESNRILFEAHQQRLQRTTNYNSRHHMFRRS